LQAPPSLPSTSRSYGSSPCNCPRSYITDSVPEGSGTHKEVRAAIRNAQRSVYDVPLDVAEAMATLTMQRFLRRHVRLHRRRPQSSIRDRNLYTSGPLATVTMKRRVRGWSLCMSWSRRPDRSCMTP
jgi:hypothetical protein